MPPLMQNLYILTNPIGRLIDQTPIKTVNFHEQRAITPETQCNIDHYQTRDISGPEYEWAMKMSQWPMSHSFP